MIAPDILVLHLRVAIAANLFCLCYTQILAIKCINSNTRGSVMYDNIHRHWPSDRHRLQSRDDILCVTNCFHTMVVGANCI